MDIERKGGNCVVISHKKYSFVVDPKISQYGLKDQGDATAQVLTHRTAMAPGNDNTVVIDGPGEYEVHNCSIKGMAAEAYNDQSKEKATIYRLELDDCTVAVVGHIKPKLTDEELEMIGIVDVLIIPVGGYGYTLDPKEAVEVIKAIGPKAIIPTHYAEEGVKYEVPQASLDDFLKELGAHQETLIKLKLKASLLPETLTVYELTRTK